MVCRSKRGVSVVELIVAVVILMFTLIGSMRLLDSGYRNNHRTYDRLWALELASMQAEAAAARGHAVALRQLGDQDSLALPGKDQFASFDLPNLKQAERFQWRVELSRAEDVVRCVTTVRWTERSPTQGDSDLLGEVQLATSIPAPQGGQQ